MVRGMMCMAELLARQWLSTNRRHHQRQWAGLEQASVVLVGEGTDGRLEGAATMAFDDHWGAPA